MHSFVYLARGRSQEFSCEPNFGGVPPPPLAAPLLPVLVCGTPCRHTSNRIRKRFLMFCFNAVCFFIDVSFGAVVSALWPFLSSRHSSAIYCFSVLYLCWWIKYSFIQLPTYAEVTERTLCLGFSRSRRAVTDCFRAPYTWGVKKIAHTRLQSVGFRSWSRFLAVSLQVMWVINP